LGGDVPPTNEGRRLLDGRESRAGLGVDVLGQRAKGGIHLSHLGVDVVTHQSGSLAQLGIQERPINLSRSHLPRIEQAEAEAR
jgi:hypothetical protein